VVAWTSSGGYGGTPPDVFGQRYASDGTPLGPEFRINTFTTNAQNRSAAAADPAGNFVVTWDSYGQDGSAAGVFGQRYGRIVPVELMHLGVE
jgi:large repetitive protein